ncbi:isochorismatase family protein [Streptomyces inhibens]|uniref:isochorismatase family protein n=1 Tax=Streptomyces inhibens TaxID=2293571 RepID=UPI00402A7CA2
MANTSGTADNETGTTTKSATVTAAVSPINPVVGPVGPIGSAEPVHPVEALLLVDLQSAFVAGDEAVPDAARLLDRSRDLLTRARAAGALVVHLQNDGAPGTVDEPHTPGWELHLPVEPGPREAVIRKTEDDGFEGTLLGALLTDAGVEELAICGVLSEMCVSATARTALARDFRVVLPHDAHATYDIPAAPGISDVVPAAMSSRAAEWALGDEVEIIAHAADVTFTASHPGSPSPAPTDESAPRARSTSPTP